jgi:hypothetical protein
MEISRTPDVISSGMQAVAAAVAKAADPQAPESLDQAIQSFAWAAIQDKPTDMPDWTTFVGGATIPEAGFSEAPSKYFVNADKNQLAKFGGIISMDQVINVLRNPSFSFEDGVAEFLKAGVQEALASLKIGPAPKAERPVMPVPLDDLLSPDKLKNPNPAALQPSLRAMTEMFATLKRMQSTMTDLDANRLRFIRA